MSDFKFPENCSYCTTSYKTEHCTLPYYLVKGFELPQDPTLRAIELTKLHCAYHPDTINQLVSTSNWHIQSATTSRASSSYNESQHSFVYNPDIMSAFAPPSTEGVRLSETTDSLSPPAEEPLPTLGSSQLNLKLTEPTLDLHGLDHQDTETASTPALETTQATPYDSRAIMHLIQDLSMAAITATNLRKIKRQNLTAQDFRECLEKELSLLFQMKEKYTPHHSTKLDHPIALAREIIATHSHDQITDWHGITHKNSITPHGCILNYLPLTRHDSASNKKRLDNCLLRFSKLSLSNPRIPKDRTRLAHLSAKEQISSRGYPTIFEWLKKTKEPVLYQNDPYFLTTIPESPKLSKDKITPPNKSKAQHFCPPTDTATTNVLSQHLDSTINAYLIEQDYVPFSNMTDDHITNLMKSMTEEIIRHNPHWTKPEFLITPTMLSQATQALDLTLSHEIENSLLWNINSIASNLKKLHPLSIAKAPFPHSSNKEELSN